LLGMAGARIRAMISSGHEPSLCGREAGSTSQLCVESLAMSHQTSA
jgi:hypothetical protein